MLTEDLKPWLIEINSSPSMAYSTKITTTLCEAVLEDTIKGNKTQSNKLKVLLQ